MKTWALKKFKLLWTIKINKYNKIFKFLNTEILKYLYLAKINMHYKNCANIFIYYKNVNTIIT